MCHYGCRMSNMNQVLKTNKGTQLQSIVKCTHRNSGVSKPLVDLLDFVVDKCASYTIGKTVHAPFPWEGGGFNLV